MSNLHQELINERYQAQIQGNEAIRVGVAVAIIDRNNRLLLELRSDVNMWGLTGGKLDIGEKPKECGIREIKEETGLTLQKSDLMLFDIYGDINDRRVLQYPDARVQLIDIVFTASIKMNEPMQISEESIALEFFRAEEIPSQIVPPAIRPIQDLIRSGLIK